MCSPILLKARYNMTDKGNLLVVPMEFSAPGLPLWYVMFVCILLPLQLWGEGFVQWPQFCDGFKKNYWFSVYSAFFCVMTSKFLQCGARIWKFLSGLLWVKKESDDSSLRRREHRDALGTWVVEVDVSRVLPQMWLCVSNIQARPLSPQYQSFQEGTLGRIIPLDPPAVAKITRATPQRGLWDPYRITRSIYPTVRSPCLKSSAEKRTGQGKE